MNYKAISIFGAAKCTLECEYCYIRKNDKIKEMDKDIASWLQDPQLPDIINGEEITDISLWGGEPSLHLDIFSNNIKKYREKLPNLKNIHMSTNMTYPKHFPIFARMISEQNLKVRVQISDDSILFNKKNRGITSDIIQKNTLNLIEELTKNGCEFEYSFKPTTSIDEFKFLTKDDVSLLTFFEYFNSFAGEIKEIVGDKYRPMVTAATIICPGAYTSNDGKVFNEYLEKVFKWFKGDKLKHLDNIIPDLSYPMRWKNVLDRISDYTNAHHTFTCSAGDSSVQVDTMGGIHLCHRPLYFVYDTHMDALKTLDNSPNDDVDYLMSGILDVYRKYYNLDPEKVKLHLRSLHDNYIHRASIATGLIMEAAHCGQASEIYKDKKAAEILAIFLITACYCPIENFFITSSWHITPLSIIRLFGNGAFETIVEIVSNINANIEKGMVNEKLS